MTRDLLPKLQQRLNAFSWESTDSIKIQHEEVKEVFEPTAMCKLLKMYSTISLQLTEIEENLESMRTMIKAQNQRNFSETEMSNLRIKNQKVANDLMNKFKKIEANLPLAQDFTTLARMKRGLYYGLFHRYVMLWSQCEEFLQRYEQKLKNNLKQQSRILNYDLTDEALEDLISNQTTNLFMGNILQDTEKERQTLNELKDRLGDLKKLEKSIEEVHDLFLRLHTLVVDQSEVLQRIENHFIDAQEYVYSAKTALEKAQELHQKRGKKRFILVIAAILIVFILIIVYV